MPIYMAAGHCDQGQDRSEVSDANTGLPDLDAAGAAPGGRRSVATGGRSVQEQWGHVLYWLGNALAMLVALLSAVALSSGATTIDVVMGFGVAVLIWLAGRVARYLFAGK